MRVSKKMVTQDIPGRGAADILITTVRMYSKSFRVTPNEINEICQFDSVVAILPLHFIIKSDSGHIM